MDVPHKYANKIEDIKKKIKNSNAYWMDNNRRFERSMNFVFYSGLTNADRQKLTGLNKPTIEFNMLNALMNRQMGEFAAHEPSFIVGPSDKITLQENDDAKKRLESQEIIQGHYTHIMDSARNDNLQYNIFSQSCGGGFSVIKVDLDYVSNKSFDLGVFLRPSFDPTLTGFDPLARQSHKGDGEYCYELYPMSEEDFEHEYGKGILDNATFSRSFGPDAFNWTYMNGNQKIVVVCEFYWKVKKKVKLYKLSNGASVTKEHYDESMKYWVESGEIKQPPIILEERWSDEDRIHKYTLCGEKVLRHEKTLYGHLPVIFVDGNSQILRDQTMNLTKQVTIPMLFHAEGMQRLKNYSGQTMASEIETMVTNKWKAPLEGIPDEYAHVYRNIQASDVVVYNAFLESDPSVQLPPPMEVQRTPTPPIVENTFNTMDRTMQMVTGSYDAVLGTNQRNISGEGIKQGALQSGAANSPFMVNYIKALNRVGEVVLYLLPRLYVTPRTIPIKRKDGSRDFYNITRDENGQLSFRYDPDDFQIKVEAGVSLQVQKQISLEMLQGLSQSIPRFGQFFGDVGLPVLLDNLDIRGIEYLKEQVKPWLEQQAQAAQNQAPPPEIALAQQQLEQDTQVRMAQVQQQAMKAEGDHAVQVAKVAVEQEKLELERQKVEANLMVEGIKLEVEANRTDAEEAREAIDVALDIAKHHRENQSMERKKEI